MFGKQKQPKIWIAGMFSGPFDCVQVICSKCKGECFVMNHMLIKKKDEILCALCAMKKKDLSIDQRKIIEEYYKNITN